MYLLIKDHGSEELHYPYKDQSLAVPMIVRSCTAVEYTACKHQLLAPRPVRRVEPHRIASALVPLPPLLASYVRFVETPPLVNIMELEHAKDAKGSSKELCRNLQNMYV